jgi:hypothetical protein
MLLYHGIHGCYWCVQINDQLSVLDHPATAPAPVSEGAEYAKLRLMLAKMQGLAGTEETPCSTLLFAANASGQVRVPKGCEKQTKRRLSELESHLGVHNMPFTDQQFRDWVAAFCLLELQRLCSSIEVCGK